MKVGLLAVGAAVGLFLLMSTWLVLFPRTNPAPRVDALLVLYTEDAVYDRAVELANEGVTDLLIVSQPDGADGRLCGGFRTGTDAEVVCFSPEPVTTQGEAIVGSELARDRGVETLGLLTFDNHLERARVVVSRCWDSDMHVYEFNRDLSLHERAYQVIYGIAAFGKTALTLGCTTEFPRPIERSVEWVKDLTRPNP
ncbi:hypothetical protein [Citricoccus sp.]|uniref:hypothetical protein n=1 Tax=Citricoccus sp. TaxID=1978372 RepID=UPI0028BDBAD6|nr:hypothetical protein [Citricoccus sp.]